jgi:glycerol-3-phosphate acyltransferase PlsY
MDAAFGGVYVITAYFLGAIPVAYLYGKARAVDISSSGSGNLGAGNTTRLLGAKAGALVALLDGLKGLMTVLAGRWLGFGTSVIAAGALASVAGSDWSVFLGRRSGRGLATSSLAMLAFDPITVVWPAVWSVIGWKIGGGISGFFGWAFIWLAAYGLGRPTETVLLGAGMGILMIIRRAQGNLNDPDQDEPLARILYDTDRRHPAPELATGDGSLA